MARSYRFSILLSALAAIVVSAAVAVGNAITSVGYRFARFVFAAIPSPAYAFAGPAEGYGGWFQPAFRDPHVARHEAGMSRRAAARGV